MRLNKKEIVKRINVRESMKEDNLKGMNEGG